MVTDLLMQNCHRCLDASQASRHCAAVRATWMLRFR
jgi:hypothetical protein